MNSTSVNTSTNQPYSGSNSSSSAPSPPQSMQAYMPQPIPVSASGFTSKELYIGVGSILLSAVVTYFTMLISVNSDISNNRENVSVLRTDVTHFERRLVGAEEDISKNEAMSIKVISLEGKFDNIQKQLDKHIDLEQRK